MSDPTAMIQDMVDSDEAFRDQFDRSSEHFHDKGGHQSKAVPLGGARVPESMGGEACKDWMNLPETQFAIEPEFPPEYHRAMENYEQYGRIKKSLGVINKPIEDAMKLKFKYKDAEGDDRTVMESRLHGAENERDGALNALAVQLDLIDKEHVSDRTRDLLLDVVERGKYTFEEKEAHGEIITMIQRCNQGLFADQKKLLAKIKEIKKAALKSNPPPAEPATAGA